MQILTIWKEWNNSNANSNHLKGIRTIRMQIRIVQTKFEAFECKFETVTSNSNHSNENSNHSNQILSIRMRILTIRNGFETLKCKF